MLDEARRLSLGAQVEDRAPGRVRTLIRQWVSRAADTGRKQPHVLKNATNTA